MPKYEDNWKWKYRRLIFIFAGAVLVFLSAFVPDTAGNIMIAFGSASLVLGLFEATFGKDFRRELAEDVFKSTAGYLLPESIRDEVRKLHSVSLFMTKNDYQITLEPAGDGVRLRERIDRTIVNRGRSTRFKPWYGAQEFLRSCGKTRVLVAVFEKGGRVWSLQDSLAAQLNDDWPVVQVTGMEEFKLDEGEECTTITESEIFYSAGDAHFALLGEMVAESTSVQVRVDDSLDYKVFFIGSQWDAGPDVGGSRTYKAKGALLPFQGIRIRWWDRQQFENLKQVEKGGEAPQVG